MPDVNVLVYAHRREAQRHNEYRDWLSALGSGTTPFALSDLVVSGFLRVVTHPRAFRDPTPVDVAREQASRLRAAGACRPLRPGLRHWSLFDRLLAQTGVRGNGIPDAFHAALAIEHGCVLVTADRGFARFPGLRWRHPLDFPEE